jgi:lipoic acid synthetase
VPYREAEALQRAVHERAADDYLLLQEHPHVYTLGSSADLAHVLRDPASVGAELVHADRGGDVTYHGPGQLVGYPIVSLAEWRAGQRDVVAYVRKLEEVLLAVLGDFGIVAERSPGYTGAWIGGEKIAAIGVRVARGRTRHGFALNINPDLTMFEHIVPCGIFDRGVTSMARVLGRDVEMREVVERVVERFIELFGYDEVERQEVAWERPVRPDAGAPGVPVSLTRKRPEWMRVRAKMDGEFLELKRLVRDLDLHTVCEEAGCPNIYECWGDRTATFMILGDRCTRACGFCLVDTRKPLAVDDEEPQRVADAVATLGLAHAVITCVARDDLPDGGAAVHAATVAAIRATSPGTAVELLISDCKGDAGSLQTIFDARPDVLNHNLETVARLQRLVRPSAGYARSLGVLARAKDAGLPTKSGIMVGLGETPEEVRAAIADLRGVGVELLTIGQYLQPSGSHLPVARWWHPDEFAALREYAEALGFAHVESGPLVRSSYHAREGAARTVPVA